MNRHTIVALVPEPFGSRLAALRHRYDVFTRQWLPPHITIIPPFELFLSRAEVEAVRDFRSETSATFDGWGVFRRSETSVLHLKLRDHKFFEIRDQLVQALPQLAPFKPDEIEAHVTAVSRIPNEQLADVESVVTSEQIEGTFTVDRLMLYRWDDEVRRWIALTQS